MKKMSQIKNLCVSAVCVALCCVLPPVFHSVGLGTAFSPLHIPVLLCGLICGPWYGLACGIIGPVLCSLINSMPGPAMLIHMVPELVTYGLATGLSMKFVRTGKTPADLYISLASAMILGRIVGGIVQSFVYMGTDSAMTLAGWAAAYFGSSLPGIVCHLLVIPVLYFALVKARLIPGRYTKSATVE